MSRDRLSRAEERKTRYVAEHLEKKFGVRLDRTNAQDLQDNTSGSSSGMVPLKSEEPGSDECVTPMARRPLANDTDNDQGEIPIPAAYSDQVLAAPGQKEVKP